MQTMSQQFPRDLTNDDFGFFVFDRTVEREVELVLAGPFDDGDAANEAKRRFRSQGYRGAMVFFTTPRHAPTSSRAVG